MSQRRPRRPKAAAPGGTATGSGPPPEPPPDFRDQGFTPPGGPPRLGLIAAIVGLALVVLICAVILVVRQQLAPATPADGEGPVARTTAQPLPSGTAVGDIGSGGDFNGGWYRLYFTAPKYPDNPANHRGGLDEKLVALIDGATTSVDVANYDFDLAPVAEALVRAKGRGATVRMVTDTDTLTNTKDAAIVAAFAKLKAAGIPIVDDKRQPIMHHKFTVVDRAWVSTGSWNYTDGDTYRLNNNMIVIQSNELAANYSAEFAKMFEKKQFGPTKDKGVPNPTITVGGSRIETCFGAEERCEPRIVAAVNGSRQSVRFMAFSFTSDPIEVAMAARRAAGVPVTGVFETTGSQTPASAYGKLKGAGAEVYTDGSPWAMHHKVIIIDERIVIFGSFNFSDNANTQNDENLLIVEDAGLARAFKVEFDRVLALAQNPPTKK